MKALALVAIVALAGCADQGYSTSDMDPGTRAALLGALMSRPAQAQYQVPFYAIPTQQSRTTNCFFAGNMMSCN